MSLTSLGYDPCEYRQSLKETMGPGMYFLGTPLPLRDGCDGPSARRVDAGSELLGLPRREGRCTINKYLGAGPGENHCPLPAPLAQRDRHMAAEDTRVSNPPSTMRGGGINRWTPLCEEPQEHALEPFQMPANDRRAAKDAHVGCEVSPMSPAGILPPSDLARSPTFPEPIADFPAVPMLPDFNGCER